MTLIRTIPWEQVVSIVGEKCDVKIRDIEFDQLQQRCERLERESADHARGEQEYCAAFDKLQQRCDRLEKLNLDLSIIVAAITPRCERCERLETCCRNMANRLAGGYRSQQNQLTDAQLVQEADAAIAK